MIESLAPDIILLLGNCVCLQGSGRGSKEQSKAESPEEGRETEAEEGGSPEAVCQGRRFNSCKNRQITSGDFFSCAGSDSCFMVTCVSVADVLIWRGIVIGGGTLYA